jgi:hypothetical protein
LIKFSPRWPLLPEPSWHRRLSQLQTKYSNVNQAALRAVIYQVMGATMMSAFDTVEGNES